MMIKFEISKAFFSNVCLSFEFDSKVVYFFATCHDDDVMCIETWYVKREKGKKV